MTKNIIIVVCILVSMFLLYTLFNNSNESQKVYDEYQKYREGKEASIAVLVDKIYSLDSTVALYEQLLAEKQGKVSELQKVVASYKTKIKSTSELVDSTREELLAQHAVKDEALFKYDELVLSLVAERETWNGIVVTLKAEVVTLKRIHFEENELRVAAEEAIQKLYDTNIKLNKQNKLLKTGGLVVVLYVIIKIIGG